jgi:hypothetical protein
MLDYSKFLDSTPLNRTMKHLLKLSLLLSLASLGFGSPSFLRAQGYNEKDALGNPKDEQFWIECFQAPPCVPSCPGALPCVEYRIRNYYASSEVVGVKFTCPDHSVGDKYVCCNAINQTTSTSWSITPSGCITTTSNLEEVYIKAPGYPGYPPSPVPNPALVTGLQYHEWLYLTICGGCPKCGIEVDVMDPVTGIISPYVIGDNQTMTPPAGDCCNPPN